MHFLKISTWSILFFSICLTKKICIGPLLEKTKPCFVYKNNCQDEKFLSDYGIKQNKEFIHCLVSYPAKDELIPLDMKSAFSPLTPSYCCSLERVAKSKLLTADETEKTIFEDQNPFNIKLKVETQTGTPRFGKSEKKNKVSFGVEKASENTIQRSPSFGNIEDFSSLQQQTSRGLSGISTSFSSLVDESFSESKNSNLQKQNQENINLKKTQKQNFLIL